MLQVVEDYYSKNRSSRHCCHNIMTFGLHAKSFSCPDDPILAPKLQLSNHKLTRIAVPEKQERRSPLTYFENNITIMVKRKDDQKIYNPQWLRKLIR